MAIRYTFISAFFILIFLTHCNDRKIDVAKTVVKNDWIPPVLTLSNFTLYHPVSYDGEWKYSFPFYSSELSINNDGTFKFHEQGCTGHGYSEGKWSKYGASILLKSFEKYADNNPLEVLWAESKTTLTFAKKKVKSEIYYTFDPSVPGTIATYKIGPGDTVNVYFDNVQLSLNGDTLYWLNKDGFRTDKKFVLIKPQH